MDARHFATAIVLHLQGNGYPAAFAGGCVRDMFLGREPNDYDVATAALPEDVERLFTAEALAGAGWLYENTHIIPVGKSFGVIIIVCGKLRVEVATLRCEDGYSDGRRPDEVRFVTSFEQDAARRDFTMNAMFMDPVTDEVSDFFGGQEDLRAGIIRAVRNASERIIEDPLRLMRAARFAARFGFCLEEDLFSAIQSNASLISRVSAERIQQELEGLLCSEKPRVGLQLLLDTGVMQHIIPELVELGSELGDQDPVWHPEGKALTHILMVVENLAGSHRNLMFAGLLHDIAKGRTQKRWPDGGISNHGHAEMGADMARAILMRLKMSSADIKAICELIRLHMKMHKATALPLGKLVNLLRRKDIEDLITLQHADSQGTLYPKRAAHSCRDFLRGKLSELEVRLLEKPLVDGQMLLGLGHRAGPAIRILKDAALIAQNEGVFSAYDLEAARHWVQANAVRILAEADAAEPQF